jgi:hypothetical protein
MSTTGSVPITAGDGGKKVAVYEINEGGENREIQRVAVVDPSGAESITALATKLDSVITYVDGLETLITATNAKMDTLNTTVSSPTPAAVIGPGEWGSVAASTTVALGAAGTIGDFLSHVTITPSSLSPGAVQIKDGSGSAVTVFAGGTNSLTNLVPFAVPLGIKSKAGGWSIITNAGATAIGVGDFT